MNRFFLNAALLCAFSACLCKAMGGGAGGGEFAILDPEVVKFLLNQSGQTEQAPKKETTTEDHMAYMRRCGYSDASFAHWTAEDWRYEFDIPEAFNAIEKAKSIASAQVTHLEEKK